MAAEIRLSQLPSLVEDPTTEFQRGGQIVSKITLAIVSIVWLAAGVFFFIALPNHSWLWLINIFNSIQVFMIVIKYIPQEARALLVRLEYQKGNIEAALHVFEGIDIATVTPRMKGSISRRCEQNRRRS
ncbi:uncharacterized protein LOC133788448 [Humulus lupulus]|uniref:uncharacterized protein LOC133788448 n=1 Tax=Humulus lupulus TaxID=3486 RepID=UPI002B416022|nr:uncharacterized protein LOC133788448 [Humulus lupulus]XP_062081914.1 uncharacterized protein LOC133788448 [Humulus lupulus]